MGYFARETMRVYFPSDPDQWVDIPAHGRFGDDEFILQHSRKGSNPELEASFLLLERNILDWSLVDEDGAPVPIDRKWLRQLRKADLNAIAEAIAERDGIELPRSDEEKND